METIDIWKPAFIFMIFKTRQRTKGERFWEKDIGLAAPGGRLKGQDKVIGSKAKASTAF